MKTITASNKKLTELQGAALGIIGLSSPCTPYQVRRVFQQSPSPHWTGSSGAIYPMIRKLESAGLIRSRRYAVGRRPCRKYSITPAGNRALQKWLRDAITDKTIGVPVDALRTRIRFLATLPSPRRAKLINEVQHRLARHIEAVRADCRRRRASGDLFLYLATRGAVLTLRARQVWLQEIRQRLR